MILKKLGATIALSAASVIAVAQPYQAELSAHITDADGTNYLGISGQGYLKTVQAQDGPLREAAFLEQASHLSLHYATDSDRDYRFSSIGLGYYVPNSIFYLGAHYQHSSFHSFSSSDWGITAGITPIEGLLLTTTYRDYSGYDPNLAAKYVRQLSPDTAINFRASYQDGGDGGMDRVVLGADYYFSHTFSVGAWVEDQRDTGIGLRVENFFTPAFSVRASYFYMDRDDSMFHVNNDNGNRASIGASLRF